eukprot:1155900-Pelagomonas_calceolata.AAC.6
MHLLTEALAGIAICHRCIKSIDLFGRCIPDLLKSFATDRAGAIRKRFSSPSPSSRPKSPLANSIAMRTAARVPQHPLDVEKGGSKAEQQARSPLAEACGVSTVTKPVQHHWRVYRGTNTHLRARTHTHTHTHTHTQTHARTHTHTCTCSAAVGAVLCRVLRLLDAAEQARTGWLWLQGT